MLCCIPSDKEKLLYLLYLYTETFNFLGITINCRMYLHDHVTKTLRTIAQIGGVITNRKLILL